jgi:hypothetical protein
MIARQNIAITLRDNLRGVEDLLLLASLRLLPQFFPSSLSLPAVPDPAAR